MEKIVITGMGTVNPLGLTVEESWRNAISGVSGVGPITLFDPTPLNVHFAAEVKGFNPDHYMDAKEARRRDRFEQLAAAYGVLAVDAVVWKPSGSRRMESPWLIQQEVFDRMSLKSSREPAMERSANPYSRFSARSTRPPRNWANS